jgi:tetratricopeptide (TPR) repeat protein
MALKGQWVYSLHTDKLSRAMQIAERLYSLAQRQDDPMVKIRGYNALSCTHYFLGEFETARQYARHGVQIWRLGRVQSYAEEYTTPAVTCLIFWAMSEWHFGEIASSHALMDEAISIAKELKDMNSLAVALSWAALLAYYERDPAEVDRFASELIELSTRHNFLYWLAHAESYRGWARSALGNPLEGISWIEQGIRDYRATSTVLGLPGHLARKAEALHLAGRTSEALETINEVEALAERFENRYWSAELRRLRGVFLVTLGAEETQIEASFCEAIKTAEEQKSVSLAKRAEAIYAEYRRQKASGSGGRRFRLPLC